MQRDGFWLGRFLNAAVGQKCMLLCTNVPCECSKGCLISERFSLWLKSPESQITILKTIHLKKDSDLASFFEDLSQSNNISEIKPPLLPSENQFLLIEKQKSKLFSFLCVQI